MNPNLPVRYCSSGFIAAPEALIHQDQLAAAGRFQGPVADLDTRHWDGNGGLLSARRLQRKAWLYGVVFSERFIVACALADAGLASNAFAYVFDRETQQLTEHQTMLPLRFAAGFQPSPQQTWHLQHRRQSWRVQPLSGLRPGWECRFDSPDLQFDFQLFDHHASISALSNTPGRPFHYTQKALGLAAQLNLHYQGQTHQLADVRGMFDFSLGYPPRYTHWQWLCLLGHVDDGREFACNAVAHFMNGLENALWLRDAQGIQVYPLAQMQFHYNPQQLLGPWHMQSADGRLLIDFTPEGARSSAINVGVLSTDFTQPFGTFTGLWIDDAGQQHHLSGLGVTEQHRALW